MAQYFIYSKHAPGKVLDVREGNRSNGAKLQIWQFQGNDHQKFTFDPMSGCLRAVHSGLSIDMDKFPHSGGHAQTWQHHGGPNQQFEIFGEQIRIRGQNLVLDVQHGGTADGSHVIFHHSHGGSNQLWQLVPVGGPPPQMGMGMQPGMQYPAPAPAPQMGMGMQPGMQTGMQPGVQYYIYAKHAQGKVLDLREASRSNGGRVQIWQHVGSENQKWTYDPASGCIRSVSSGLALDMDSYPNNGGHIQQWQHHGGPNQQWDLVGDQIKSRQGNIVLDIPNQAYNDGQHVQGYTNVGSPNQRWYFVPVQGAPPMY